MKCKFCKSTKTTCIGQRRGKQAYRCKSCNRSFVKNDGRSGRKMKYNIEQIKTKLTKHFKEVGIKKNDIHGLIIKQVYNKIAKKSKNFISLSYFYKIYPKQETTI